jgi:hypothetical protein
MDTDSDDDILEVHTRTAAEVTQDRSAAAQLFRQRIDMISRGECPDQPANRPNKADLSAPIDLTTEEEPAAQPARRTAPGMIEAVAFLASLRSDHSTCLQCYTILSY